MGRPRASDEAATRGDRRPGRDPEPFAPAPASAARRLLLGSMVAFLVPSPATGQILDAAWKGREDAARFFHQSMEKQSRPPDWAGSIEQLKKSVEQSPEPYWEASIQDGSGRWRWHYLPYFYLGLAYWRQGDCPKAVAALSTSLEKGEVCKGKQGERKELEKVLLKCEQQGSPSARPARDLVKSECSKVPVARRPEHPVAGFERIARAFEPAVSGPATDFSIPTSNP